MICHECETEWKTLWIDQGLGFQHESRFFFSQYNLVCGTCSPAKTKKDVLVSKNTVNIIDEKKQIKVLDNVIVILDEWKYKKACRCCFECGLVIETSFDDRCWKCYDALNLSVPMLIINNANWKQKHKVHPKDIINTIFITEEWQ